MTRALRLAALATGLLSLLPPTVASAQRAELEKILRRTVLPNGLEVVAVEAHGVPIATIEVNVRNGAFTQTPEFEGLAHMYEHMFFKANASHPEPEAFLDRAADLGAIFNGTTSEERVNYYFTIPADSLAGGLRFMAAALRTPLFRNDELERERQVVLGEYDRAESSPAFPLTNALTAKLYPGAFSRKNIIGDRRVLQTTTPAKMRAIQQKYYVPNNCVLIVTGDIVPDSVFRLAERHFGDWKRGPDPFVADPIPPIRPLERNDAVIVEHPVGAIAVLVQWQGPSVGADPEATYAADVFSDVLNQPGSGFQERLVDSGLWQGILVNYYTLDHVGPITISGQTSPEKLRAALDALHAEIARFAEPGYISVQELAQVKTQRAVTSEFGRERASDLTHTIGFWWSVASLEYFMGYVDNMARQTTADVQRYAARYIVGRPRVTGVLVAPDARAALQLTEDELRAEPRP